MQSFKTKKNYGPGTTILMISSEEIEHRINIFKSLEESGLLIKRISKTIKNEAKEQKSLFLPISFGTLAVSKLGNSLSGKGVIRAEEGVIRVGQSF